MITFEHLQAFFIVVLGFCALVAAIAGLVTAIVRYWKFAHRQSDENAEDLKDVMEYLKNDKERILFLEERLGTRHGKNNQKSTNIINIYDD